MGCNCKNNDAKELKDELVYVRPNLFTKSVIFRYLFMLLTLPITLPISLWLVISAIITRKPVNLGKVEDKLIRKKYNRKVNLNEQ